MIIKIRRFMKGRRGQGMTEYIIMVGLVAIAAISIYTAFGRQIRNAMSAIGLQLSGNTTANQQQAAQINEPGNATLGNFGN